MSTDTTRPRLKVIIPLALALTSVGMASAQAGGHKRMVVPVYAQQAPAPVAYGAPTTVTYATQATTTYSAPATTMYSAPMATTTYSAPVPMAYSAPTQSQSGVGFAPGAIAGGRIKAVDRDDIIEELRKEYKEAGTDGSRRDRRKTLRDSARTKYAEAVGDEAEGLKDPELQDIENIVNAIMDSSATSSNANGNYNGYSAPSYTTGYAPIQQVQAQIVQPVVPVQVWVPVQPKHRLFHH